MCQNPISENINAYKKQNKCVSLRRQCIKQHLAKITEKGMITTNKEFWNFIKPFLRNKGFSKNNDITLKKNHNRWKELDDLLNKKQNKCVSLRRQCIKQHLAKITEKGMITTNKEFWNFIKPFLRNKGFSKNNDITLKKNHNRWKKLADLLNSHYINIVGISIGIFHMQYKSHRWNSTYCKPIQGSPKHRTDQKEENTW